MNSCCLAMGLRGQVPPLIKWTLSTNDKEGACNGNRENEKTPLQQ
jgi:hypothetical protein